MTEIFPAYYWQTVNELKLRIALNTHSRALITGAFNSEPENNNKIGLQQEVSRVCRVYGLSKGLSVLSDGTRYLPFDSSYRGHDNFRLGPTV